MPAMLPACQIVSNLLSLMGDRHMVHSFDGILKMRKIIPVSFYNLKINLDTPQKREKKGGGSQKEQANTHELIFIQTL